MTNYNEIFNSEKNQKYYMLINTNMNLLLDPYTNIVYNELIHLSNIKQKISIRTIMRLTRISSEKVQSCIKVLRQLNIIGNTGYVLNLDKIEELYTTLNNIIKLDDKIAYCDSLLNCEQAINEPEAIETIQQEEEEPTQEQQPIYNKVEEQQEQPTIDIEPTQEPIKEQPMQEHKEEPIKEEEVTTESTQEQAQNTVQVPSKQVLEKNAYILINRMMQCKSKKEWAEKQDKLLSYLAQDKTWTKDELNNITTAIIETKTMWEEEKYTKSMSLINAAQCGI